MEIHQVGAELFHEERDRQTDMTKVKVAFRNFAKAPETGITQLPLRTLDKRSVMSAHEEIKTRSFTGQSTLQLAVHPTVASLRIAS